MRTAHVQRLTGDYREKTPVREKHILELEQIPKLLSVLEEPVRTMVWLALLTGLRIGAGRMIWKFTVYSTRPSASRGAFSMSTITALRGLAGSTAPVKVPQITSYGPTEPKLAPPNAGDGEVDAPAQGVMLSVFPDGCRCIAMASPAR